MSKPILEWEFIDDFHSRAKVPGGWLIKVYASVGHIIYDRVEVQDGWDWRVSITFMPDPSHIWGTAEDTL